MLNHNTKAAVFFVGLGFAFWIGGSVARGETPSPPVNQHLGIPDSVFNDMVESDCRYCHNQTPPAGFPIDPTYLPDRHHLKVGMTIPTETDVPTPDANGDGTPDTTYDCLNCHELVWDGGSSSWVLSPDFRDCTGCHQQDADTTVHHRLARARTGECTYCHGGFVDRGLFDTDDDGYADTIDAPWVPTYEPSLVTPWPNDKDVVGKCSVTTTTVCKLDGECPAGEFCMPDGVVDDGVDVYGLCASGGERCLADSDCELGDTCTNPDGIPDPSSAGTYAGNCDYCHNTSDGGSTPTPDTEGPFSPVDVYRTATTHHSPGFANEGYCTWCHDVHQPKDYGIRICETCHGIPSLHNVQFSGQAPGFPSDGTVVPGAEPFGMGHIGSNMDCVGCHGFDNTALTGASFAPGSGPVVPGLYALSQSSLHVGTVLQLQGTAFVNLVKNPASGEYDISLASDVVLVDAGGVETLLTPQVQSGDTLEVVVEGVSPGNYRVMASKAGRKSNPLNLVVTEPAVIDSASCEAGVVTLSGSGFGPFLDARDAGMKIEGWVRRHANGKGPRDFVAGTILTWLNHQIVAEFPSCPERAVDVTTLVAQASFDLSDNDGGASEICDDGIDNDGDGKVDCADKKDCRTHQACRG